MRLIDLCFIGKGFTWNNRWSGLANIQERIDRGFANEAWMMLFPHATITHLVAIKSDHCPLLLQLVTTVLHLPRPFHFESTWIMHNETTYVSQEAWQRSPYIITKLKTTKIALKEWNRHSFGHLPTKISSLKEMLKQIQIRPQTLDNLHRELIINRELESLLAQEELLWKYKAKAKWNEERDANTHYFHLTTIIHRNHNAIHRILTKHNIWIFEREQIGKAFEQYFSTLFSSILPSFPESLQVLIPHQISHEANLELERVPEP